MEFPPQVEADTRLVTVAAEVINHCSCRKTRTTRELLRCETEAELHGERLDSQRLTSVVSLFTGALCTKIKLVVGAPGSSFRSDPLDAHPWILTLDRPRMSPQTGPWIPLLQERVMYRVHMWRVTRRDGCHHLITALIALALSLSSTHPTAAYFPILLHTRWMQNLSRRGAGDLEAHDARTRGAGPTSRLRFPLCFPYAACFNTALFQEDESLRPFVRASEKDILSRPLLGCMFSMLESSPEFAAAGVWRHRWTPPNAVSVFRL